MTVLSIGLDDVRAAAVRLRSVARRTPTIRSDVADDGLWLKCEHLQRSGSFKLRGIYNRVATLDPSHRAAGIAIVSAGNAGAAAALSARLVDIPCIVVVPERAVRTKLEAIQALGAELVPVGGSIHDLFEAADTLARERGLVTVHPCDDAQVIAGQGTIALELLDDVPQMERLVVPTAGGGMLAGCALVLKAVRPEIELVGVEAVGAAKLERSLAAGEVVVRQEVDTLADGLAYPGYGLLNFDVVRERVDRVVQVSDDQLLAAMGRCWRDYGAVVEPSGAAAVAAVAADPGPKPATVVAVASGGNVDFRLLSHALAGGTAKDWVH